MSKTAVSRNSNRSKLFINMKEETAKRKKLVASKVQRLGQGTVVFREYSNLKIVFFNGSKARISNSPSAFSKLDLHNVIS